MSCHEQGTAGAGQDFLAEPYIPREDGSNVATSGLLQVMPEDFTRTELHKLLDRTRDLLRFGMLSDVKREYLECIEEDLDVLDALAAREELDILEMTSAIQNDPHYVPHIRRAHL